MDRKGIIEQLRAELDSLTKALEALEGTITRRLGRASRNGARRNHLTAEGRRRISHMMKKRWAERRRKAAKPSTRPASRKRHISKAGRERIAKAQRARWAKLKKQQEPQKKAS